MLGVTPLAVEPLTAGLSAPAPGPRPTICLPTAGTPVSYKATGAITGYASIGAPTGYSSVGALVTYTSTVTILTCGIGN